MSLFTCFLIEPKLVAGSWRAVEVKPRAGRDLRAVVQVGREVGRHWRGQRARVRHVAGREGARDRVEPHAY